MKFIVTSSNLLQALIITGKCIASRSIAPIYECYLFKINGNRLEITATNSEVFLTTSIEIESENVVKSIAIRATLLSNLIKTIPEQPIVFEIEENCVNIQALTG